MQSLVYIKSVILLKGLGIKTNTEKFEDFLGIEKFSISAKTQQLHNSGKKVPLRQKEPDQLKERVASSLQNNRRWCFFFKFNNKPYLNVYPKSASN